MARAMLSAIYCSMYMQSAAVLGLSWYVPC